MSAVLFGHALSINFCIGEAVQVDPMKPTLKAPTSKRLKLVHEKVLSDCAFKFNLCRYTSASRSC